MTATVHDEARRERSQARKERWHLLRRRPTFVFGSLIIMFWVFCAIGGEGVTTKDPNPTLSKLGTPFTKPFTDGYLFGTDSRGRDVLSRVMSGARDVFLVAPIAAILGVLFGTMLGLIMGYFRGWVDEVLGRLIDAVLAIPLILIALLVTTVLGKSKIVVIGTVAVLFTPIVARTVRAAVMAEAQLDYVTSAKLRGESAVFIMSREIIPNVTSPIIVELTVRIGYAVFTVATLAFLGAGPQPPSADWGLTISQEYGNVFGGQWWPATIPAIAIASLVIGINLVADSIEAVYNA